MIAGVNKAGTTSLFVSLSTHPDVAPSAMKETRYFLPARYGQPLEPFSVYQDYFRDAGDRPVHLEATPELLLRRPRRRRGASSSELVDPHVLLVLREPVARAISFFKYQKVRLRFPAGPLHRRLPRAGRPPRAPPTSTTPTTRSTWRSAAAATPTTSPTGSTASAPAGCASSGSRTSSRDPGRCWRPSPTALGLDPARFPDEALSSENRTTGYRNARFQRLALAGQRPARAGLPTPSRVKRKLRALLLPAQRHRDAPTTIPARSAPSSPRRYREPNARLAASSKRRRSALAAMAAAADATRARSA